MLSNDEMLELEELARTNPLVASLKDNYQELEGNLAKANGRINYLEIELEETNDKLVSLQNRIFDLVKDAIHD